MNLCFLFFIFGIIIHPLDKVVKTWQYFLSMSTTKFEEQAINQALAGDWKMAVNLNLEILKQNCQDIDALCRLAKAYAELNKNQLALKIYKKILRLDRFNQIAKKNLAKFLNKGFSKKKKNEVSKIEPGLFLEEPGKTKIVPLIKLGIPKILLSLDTSSPVKLMPRKRSISVYDKNHRYLGKLPDDISLRLIKLIRSGNQYNSTVKSVNEKNLSIFIKETKRSKTNNSIPSFPLSKNQYYSFIPPAVVKRQPIEAVEKVEE